MFARERASCSGTGLSRTLVRRLPWLAAAVLAAGCGSSSSASSPSCPSNADTFAAMNAATYAIVPVVKVGPNPTDLAAAAIATAFAVDGRLLATNAHVTEFFNSRSVDFGLAGQQVVQVVAMQSGTGKVIQLLRGLTHPRYTGDPLRSPDVGLLTTREVLPSPLRLASDQELAGLALGDTLLLTGFPGDVNQAIPMIPGQTVPQATSLSGSVTAFRNQDSTVAVTPQNRDIIQHQAPTSPGSSGSAITACGRVVGINNAGTHSLVVTPDGKGGFVIERVPTAANNFAVSVKYIAEMISLFNDQAIQGFELPPPFVPPPACLAAPATNQCTDASYPADCGPGAPGGEACCPPGSKFVCAALGKCYATQEAAQAACGNACQACNATPTASCTAAPATNQCTNAAYPQDCGPNGNGGELCCPPGLKFSCAALNMCYATSAAAQAACGNACQGCL